MRYIGIACGMVKAALISVFSGGKIKYKNPIRLNAGARFSVRTGGKIILGKHVSLNHNARLGVTENACMEIGSFTSVGDNNVIVAREKISIGNNVMIGPNVCIYDHNHIFKEDGIMRELGYETAPVTIEDNVWLAAGVIVLKGVTIGEGSVIAAGTLVNKDIPRNSVVYNSRELVIKERIEGI